MSGQDEEIEAEDRAPDVSVERGQGAPGTAVKAKDSLEPGDDGFDASAETAELSIDPIAASHVLDLETASLGERDVLDTQVLQDVEVRVGGEASIEGRLARRLAVEVDLALDHGLWQ